MSDAKIALDPPQLEAKLDINPDLAAFEAMGTALAQHPDICRLTQDKRKGDAYLVNRPEFAKHVLVNNHKNYHKGEGIGLVKMLLGNGIVVLDGDVWARHRKMILPGFQRRFVSELSRYMQQSNLEIAPQWEALADSGQPLDISQAMNELSLRIIMRALISTDFERLLEQGEGNHPFAIFSEDQARDLKLVARFRSLTKVIQAVIDLRREEGRVEVDFLSQFMTAIEEQGLSMSDKELIDEVMTLIVAGHETTANTLSWCWYLLSQNPEQEASLHRELDQIDRQEFANPGEQEPFVYTEQVLKETVRLYPAVWMFSRKALQEDWLGDYCIPAGADVFLSPYYIQRREDMWQQPHDFRPERFDKQNPQLPDRFAYIPFSGGSRRCIGDFFGMVEMKMHLAWFAKRYSLSFHESDNHAVTLEPGINLRSKHPLMMRINKR